MYEICNYIMLLVEMGGAYEASDGSCWGVIFYNCYSILNV